MDEVQRRDIPAEVDAHIGSALLRAAQEAGGVNDLDVPPRIDAARYVEYD